MLLVPPISSRICFVNENQVSKYSTVSDTSYLSSSLHLCCLSYLSKTSVYESRKPQGLFGMWPEFDQSPLKTQLFCLLSLFLSPASRWVNCSNSAFRSLRLVTLGGRFATFLKHECKESDMSHRPATTSLKLKVTWNRIRSDVKRAEWQWVAFRLQNDRRTWDSNLWRFWWQTHSPLDHLHSSASFD